MKNTVVKALLTFFSGVIFENLSKYLNNIMTLDDFAS